MATSENGQKNLVQNLYYDQSELTNYVKRRVDLGTRLTRRQSFFENSI